MESSVQKTVGCWFKILKRRQTATLEFYSAKPWCKRGGKTRPSNRSVHKSDRVCKDAENLSKAVSKCDLTDLSEWVYQ